MGRKPKSSITDRCHGIFSQKRDVVDAGRRILSHERDMTDVWVAQKFQSIEVIFVTSNTSNASVKLFPRIRVRLYKASI